MLYVRSLSVRVLTLAGFSARFVFTPLGAPAFGMCTVLLSMKAESSTDFAAKLLSAKRLSMMALCHISLFNAMVLMEC